MQAGAVGYVTKGAGPEEMISAINTVMSGSLFMSSRVAQKMALKNYSGAEKSPFDQLSDRELQTALAIANGQRAQEIAEIFNVSPKTINSYRYRIFDKLKVSSDVELTLLAVKHNILDPESVV
jgi:DNA-binding NarL/FixJ family response regulator